MCVCSSHRCCSNWFHGEDARDGRAWKADKEKRPYIILLLYSLYCIRIPPVLNLHLYSYTGKPSCAPDDDIFYARRKKKINK